MNQRETNKLSLRDSDYVDTKNCLAKIVVPAVVLPGKIYDLVMTLFIGKLGYLKDSNAAAHSVDTGIS